MATNFLKLSVAWCLHNLSLRVSALCNHLDTYRDSVVISTSISSGGNQGNDYSTDYAFDGVVAACASQATLCQDNMPNIMFSSSKRPEQWISFKFPTSVDISSVFLSLDEEGDDDGVIIEIYVDSTLCWSSVNALVTSVWANCDDFQTFTGTELKIQARRVKDLRIVEVMAFAEFNIQHNYDHVQSTAVVTGSQQTNALQQNMLVNTATETDGFTSTVESGNCDLEVHFKAEIPFNCVLMIPLVDQEDPSQVNKYSEETIVGLFEFRPGQSFRGHSLMLVQNQYPVSQPEFDMTSTELYWSKAIRIRTRNLDYTNSIGIASFGILTECKCLNTLTSDTSIVGIYYFSSIFDITEIVLEAGQIVTLQHNEIYDSVSLTCGNADGLTFCGEREILFDGLPYTSVSQISAYNSTTRTFTFLIDESYSGGTVQFTTSVRLVDYPSVIFPQSQVITAVIRESCAALVGSSSASSMTVPISDSNSIAISFSATDSDGVSSPDCQLTALSASISNSAGDNLIDFTLTETSLTVDHSIGDVPGEFTATVSAALLAKPEVTASFKIAVYLIEECHAIAGVADGSLMTLPVGGSDSMSFIFSATDSDGVSSPDCKMTISSVSITSTSGNEILSYEFTTDTSIQISYGNDLTPGEYLATIIGSLDAKPAATASVQFTVSLLDFFRVDDGSILSTLHYRVVNDATKIWNFQIQDTVDYQLISPVQEVLTTPDNFQICEAEVCILFDTNSQSISVNATTMSEDIDLELNFLELGTGTVIYTQALKLEFTPCVLTDLQAEEPNKVYFYMIGGGTTEMQLTKYEQTPACDYDPQDIMVVEPIVIGNYGSSLDLKVQNATQLLVSCSNPKLIGQIVEATIDAVAGNLTVQSNIQIRLIAEPENNEAPELPKDPLPPPVIPCLSDAKAKTWVYTFDSAFDLENHDFSIGFDCASLPNEMFIKEIQITQLSLSLNTVIDDITSTKDTCALVLKDVLGKVRRIDVDIEIECVEKNDGEVVFTPEKRDLVVPGVKRIEISQKGLVTITFTVQVKNLTSLESLVKPSLNRTLGDRALQEDKIYPIEVTLMPGTDGDPERLQFSPYVSGFDGIKLEIKTGFEYPSAVSMKEQPDQLEVKFNQPNVFVSDQGVALNNDTELVLKSPLPRQKDDNIFILDLGAVVEATMYTAAASAVLSHPVLLYFLNTILGAVEIIKILTHLTGLNLSYPEIVISFFIQLFPLITFDLVPTDPIYGVVFLTEEYDDQELSYQLASVGYENTLAINNIGFLLILILIQPVTVAIVSLMLCCTTRCTKQTESKICLCRYLNKFHQSLKAKDQELRWNGILRFYFENYLVLSMVGWISITDLRLTSYSHAERFSSLLGIVLFAFSFGYLIILVVVLESHLKLRTEVARRNDEAWALASEQRKGFLEKYGQVLQNLDIDRIGRWQALSVPLIKLGSQLMIVLSVTVLNSWSTELILLVMSLQMMQICYVLHLKPFKNGVSTSIELWSLFTYLYLTYVMLEFTDFVHFTISIKAGEYFVYGTLVSISVILLLFTLPAAMKAHLHCKRCRSRIRRRSEITRRIASSRRQQRNSTASATQQQQQVVQAPPVMPPPLEEIKEESERMEVDPADQIPNLASISSVNIQELRHEMIDPLRLSQRSSEISDCDVIDAREKARQRQIEVEQEEYYRPNYNIQPSQLLVQPPPTRPKHGRSDSLSQLVDSQHDTPRHQQEPLSPPLDNRRTDRLWAPNQPIERIQDLSAYRVQQASKQRHPRQTDA